MAKMRKKNLSDKTRSKKKDVSVKKNPFEIKINRQKHNVLNKKFVKHDHGMPGASRSKALKKV